MTRIETVELNFLLPWGTKPLHPSWRLNPSPVTLLAVATASRSQDGLAHGVGPQRETQAWFAIPGSGQTSQGVGGCHQTYTPTLTLCGHPQILESPMSFFDRTPTGRLMNRFSKDMDELDVRLPFHAENFLQQFFMVLFILVILAAVFPAVLLVLAVLALGFFILLR